MRSVTHLVFLSAGLVGATPFAFAVTINEILYAPAPGGPNLEFVELFNEASEPKDISGYHFIDGIAFRFDYPTFISGKGRLVVAADRDAMLAAFPHLANVDPLFPRVVGNFAGKLDDAGERVTLANPGGAIVSTVRYNNRGAWPPEADKTGHSLAKKNPYLDGERAKSWVRSPLVGGSPALDNFGERVLNDTLLVDVGETWRYLKGLKANETDPDPPSLPADAWRQLAFDDSAWLAGPTGIGFESNRPELFATTLDDMRDNYISVYLRKTFEIASKDDIDRLVLRAGFDDGFIAYLNGVEAVVKNMDPASRAYTDRATGSGEVREGSEREDFDLGHLLESALVAGTNVLAVQVHNLSASSTDFGFLPSLLYQTESTIGGLVEIPVKINEVFATPASGDPGEKWIELYNDSDTPVDLSGFYLGDSPTALDRYRLPGGSSLPPRGYVVFTEAQLAGAGIAFAPRGEAKTAWIGLTHPEQNHVVDACSFHVEAGATHSVARYPDGARNWVAAREPTRGAANRFAVETGIVINEIMYSPYRPAHNFPEPGSIYRDAEDRGEFIELHNRSGRPIVLGGWSLTEAFDFELPAGTTIEAGGFLVIAKDPDWIAEHYGLERAKILGPYYNLRTPGDGEEIRDLSGGFLSNNDEEIVLLDELGNEADSVHYYDSGSWPLWADGRGASLELIDPSQDNAEAGAWDASLEHEKAEWTRVSYTTRFGAGEAELKFMLLTEGIVIVDNVSVRPTATAGAPNSLPYGDFEAPLAANEILFGGTHAWSGITTEAKDGNGALRIVSTGRGNNRADRIECNVFTPRLAAGQEVEISFDARWVAGEGVLLTAGYNHSMARSHFLFVPQRGGTPGTENSVRRRFPAGNVGPVIGDVEHEPVLPPPHSPVVVTARVSDSDGVAAVDLLWKIDGVDDGFRTTPMKDDGENADRAAGDGVYTATVEAQALDTIVVYRIAAADARGNTHEFPPREETRTASLYVDSTNLQPAASQARPPTRNLLYQHTLYEPDSVDSYRMIFSVENWSYLTRRPIMSNDLVPASFVFNDAEIYHNVGIRFGNSPWTRSSYSPANASYRTKFGDDSRFHGWKKFKIDNQRNENLMEERVAFYLFRANASNAPYASPPYLEHLYCQPYTNNQPLVHVYDHLEIPGPDFIDRWYPGDENGTLFKMDDRFEVTDEGQRVSSVEGRVQYPPQGGGDGGEKEEYRWYFFHRTRDKYDDFSELMDLSFLLDSRRTRSDEFNETLFDRVNVEEFIRCWSVIFNIDDWDTWGAERGKNCYLYLPRLDGRWLYIPWDKDLIFGSTTRLPLVPQNHREAVRITQSPNGRRVLHNVLDEMLDTFWTREYVSRYFQEVVEALPRANIGTYTRAATFITSRASTMRAAVAAGAGVAFEITEPAADVVSQDEDRIVVEGQAPYGVWHLSLNHDGETTVLETPADVNWNLTRWTTRAISLRPGANRLLFVGFNRDGSGIVGQDSLTVLVSGGGGTFVRGDADGDGEINLNDVLFTANYLFLDGPAAGCLDAADTDDSGRLDITDALVLANYLFLEGPLPPAPFPEAGADPTPDGLPVCP